MTALFIPKAAHLSDLRHSSQSTGLETEPRRFSTVGTRTQHELEPPERALQVCEPPELGVKDHVEAPDAGEGRDYPDDRDLRHGRSRG